MLGCHMICSVWLGPNQLAQMPDFFPLSCFAEEKLPLGQEKKKYLTPAVIPAYSATCAVHNMHYVCLIRIRARAGRSSELEHEMRSVLPWIRTNKNMRMPNWDHSFLQVHQRGLTYEHIHASFKHYHFVFVFIVFCSTVTAGYLLGSLHHYLFLSIYLAYPLALTTSLWLFQSSQDKWKFSWITKLI